MANDKGGTTKFQAKSTVNFNTQSRSNLKYWLLWKLNFWDVWTFPVKRMHKTVSDKWLRKLQNQSMQNKLEAHLLIKVVALDHKNKTARVKINK
ncbi:hypothetical protein H5410_050091 [Solanum commersonii]|uniref:Uncharacterized protein n=1 Tax=Solanum commersonii TaxID=4109 RepID=A0A9J5WWV1_SOLCO|nr:hypothetical protein H5410_050091 [Solanum commersonii]